MNSNVSISIHLLSDVDLAAAEVILAAAFHRSDTWHDDLRFYLQLQPDGYFGAYQNGILVGMVGATIYSTYAYVGLMVVHPDYQHQGVGGALMRHLLAWLEQQKVSQVILDASNAGQPLYEKLGFVAFDEVTILQRQGGFNPSAMPPNVHAISEGDLNRLVEGDTQAFGADRSRVLEGLLRAYAGRAFMVQDNHRRPGGYLFAQSSRIGPWVMQRPEHAQALLCAALSLPFQGDISVVVPEPNHAAIELLQDYEFKKVRVNRHMGRGSRATPEQNQKIFAKASLAIG